MKYDLGLNDKLNFDKVDLTPADIVVEEIAKELKSETRGLVDCNVKPYAGEIYSRIVTKPSSMASSMAMLTSAQLKACASFTPSPTMATVLP